METYLLRLRPFTPYWVIGKITFRHRDTTYIKVENPYSKREYKRIIFTATPEFAESFAREFGPYVHTLRLNRPGA